MLKSAIFLFVVFFWNMTVAQECRKNVILFDDNRSKSEIQFVQNLDTLLLSLSADTTYLLEIHGHTDDRGTEMDNHDLAQERINFVKKHIEQKGLKNVKILTKNYGETALVSKKDKENRRVEIFIFPINDDATITIKGDEKSTVNVPVGFFAGCGYCEHEHWLKMETTNVTYGKNNLGASSILIESDCAGDIYCFAAEFRFPYEKFNSPSDIKVPRPLTFRSCTGNLFGKDSISIEEDYYKGFKVRFDTITNEYVVTHDCFQPGYNTCCGGDGGGICYEIYAPFTDSVSNRNTIYTYKFKKTYRSPVEFGRIELGDTNYFEHNPCPEFDQVFMGTAYVDGELRFLNKSIYDIRKIPVFNEWNILDHYKWPIYLYDYQPLQYLQSKIRVKVPKKMPLDAVGFYITELDYFIPMSQLKPGQYQYQILDFPYVFGLKTGDEMVEITYTAPKKKYSKRKKVLKVKITEELVARARK